MAGKPVAVGIRGFSSQELETWADKVLASYWGSAPCLRKEIISGAHSQIESELVMFVKVVDQFDTRIHEGDRVSYRTVWNGKGDDLENKECLVINIWCQERDAIEVCVDTGRTKNSDDVVKDRTVLSGLDFAFVYIMNDAGETVEKIL